jgi:hypothetical protein
MAPVRLNYATLETGDKLRCSALLVGNEIDYFGSKNIMFGAGTSTANVALPPASTMWYNNYHVLTTVYTQTGDSARSHLSYYTTSSRDVTTLWTGEVVAGLAGTTRQGLSIAWGSNQSSPRAPGSVNFRRPLMFPSALTDEQVAAAAAKVLSEPRIDPVSFVVPGYVPNVAYGLGSAPLTFVQGASNYTIDVSNGWYRDGRNGPLGGYFLLSTASDLTTADLSNLLTSSNVAAMGSNAAKSNLAYAAPGASNIMSLGMRTSNFWNAASKSFSNMTETSASSLTAYMLFRDAASNFGSTSNAVFVNDVTPPIVAGPVSFIQDAIDYAFTASNGSYADGRNGPLGAFLLLSPSSNIAASEMSNIFTARRIMGLGPDAAQSKLYYTAPGASNVSDLDLWTYDMWNHDNKSFSNIADDPPEELTAYVVVRDAAHNYSAASNTVTVKKTVPLVYSNEYVELPNFGNTTTTIKSMYSDVDGTNMANAIGPTGAAAGTAGNTNPKTIIAWFDRSGTSTAAANFDRWESDSNYIDLQSPALSNFHLVAKRTSDGSNVGLARPAVRTVNAADRLNTFIALTQSADGLVKIYTNFSGSSNSGAPLAAGSDAHIGPLVLRSATEPTRLPRNLLDIKDFTSKLFPTTSEIHWKDLIVAPHALRINRIQSAYDRPRHVMDLHGASISRTSNIVTKSAQSECRAGVPVYMHGKAYFEFDALGFHNSDDRWGLAESTWPPADTGFGSEKSGTRNISVSGGHGGSIMSGGNARMDQQLIASLAGTTKATFSLAVDYDQGYAWWGVNGFFGNPANAENTRYTPSNPTSVIVNSVARKAQVDPAVPADAAIDVKRMRYAVIRPFSFDAKIFLKTSYAYTPQGFTPFYTYQTVAAEVNSYVEIPEGTTSLATLYGVIDKGKDLTNILNTLSPAIPAKTVVVWQDITTASSDSTAWKNQNVRFRFPVLTDTSFFATYDAAGTTATTATTLGPGCLFSGGVPLNGFFAVTENAEGELRFYNNLTGSNSGAFSNPTRTPGSTGSNPGPAIALVATRTRASMLSPNGMFNLDFTTMPNLVADGNVHTRDFMAFPYVLKPAQIQALYDKPRHVVDIETTAGTPATTSRFGNIVSRSSATEVKAGVPVFMHGKAYFEFDAQGFNGADDRWGLAETTRLRLTSEFGSEVTTGLSPNRSISVAAGFGGSLWSGSATALTGRPVLSTDTTQRRRTYCLAVDYDAGLAWWGVNGVFGAPGTVYNPSAPTNVTVGGVARRAQVDPLVSPDSTTINVRRMRYAVIRPRSATAIVFFKPKGRYEHTPAGFTAFSTYATEVQAYSQEPMDLSPAKSGAVWRANSVSATTTTALPSLLADGADTTASQYISGTGGTLAAPHWVDVTPPFARVVNKARIRCMSSADTTAPDLFTVQGSSNYGDTWSNLHERTVSNGWRTTTRALAGVLEDVFFFHNTTAYQAYRLTDNTGLGTMQLTTLDLFYEDPAGVLDAGGRNVPHYESLYSLSATLLSRNDSFADKSEPKPRSLAYDAYTLTNTTANVAREATAFPPAGSPITGATGDFTVMVPVRLGYATDSATLLATGDKLRISVLHVATDIDYKTNRLTLSGASGSTSAIDNAMPLEATKWFNNYHVLTTVFYESTSSYMNRSYLSYYTTDSSSVTTIKTAEVQPGLAGTTRSELKLAWGPSATARLQGSINFRRAVVFPSALTEAQVAAAAKKIVVYSVGSLYRLGPFSGLAAYTDQFNDRSAPTARSLSYAAQTFAAIAVNQTLIVNAFTDATSEITETGDYTIMFPMRLTFDVAAAVQLDRFNILTLRGHLQLRYNHESPANTKLAFFDGIGDEFGSLTPSLATRWFNNYHVLTIVHKASTSRLTGHLHYYSTDPNDVSTVKTEGPFVSGGARRPITFQYQTNAARPSGSVVLRRAHTVASALSDDELMARARQLLMTAPDVK